jgi:hypothetical protein
MTGAALLQHVGGAWSVAAFMRCRLRQSWDPCWRVVRLGASNEDEGSARRHRWDVQHDPPRNVPQQSFARHPVRAREREAAHVREIVNEALLGICQ